MSHLFPTDRDFGGVFILFSIFYVGPDRTSGMFDAPSEFLGNRTKTGFFSYYAGRFPCITFSPLAKVFCIRVP
jgi:hypothetical protein